MDRRGNFDYFHLRGTMDDVLRDRSARMQAGDEWTITNMLPTRLELWVEKRWSGDPKPFASIGPRETLKYSPSTFGNGDQLYTYYISENGKIPFLRPYVFRDIWKNIRLGDVTYRSTDGHLQTQASNWDMRGVWLHNKTAVPLDIYYKGRLAAQVFANDNMNYLGGSASSVYFDNDRQGLDFMDTITIKYSLPGKSVYLYTIYLNDIQAQSINLGDVDGGIRGPDPDTFAYSVDRPVWTGITYYVPTGRYNTRATNPLAPF